MYVVAGVTGHTGKVVAETLLAQNKPVTVIVRSEEKGEPWRAKGAKIAITDLQDAEKLSGYLARAQGAYLLIPPNYGNPDLLAGQRKVAEAIAKAVSDSMIPHVVFLSSIGAHLTSGTGLILVNHYGETELKPVAKNLTFLRPAFFLENWESQLAPIKKDGVLPSFLIPEQKIPMIATRDIGRIAAESLLNPPNGCRIIEMAGPSEYSPADIALAASTVLNRAVRVQGLPVEAAVSAFTNLGFPPEVARLFAEMYAAINSGYVAYERKDTEFKRGTITELEVMRELLTPHALGARTH